MKLLFANCEKSVSLEPPQWVEMAHDNRDNERPERTRGVVRGEYGVGSSAGALYQNWCPHWQPAEQAHVELGKPPHRLRRQPRLNRLRPEVIPTTRIPRHGHLCLLGVLVVVGLVGAGVLTLGVLHIRFFGVSAPQQVAAEIFSALGRMAELYLVTLAASLLVFPLLWHRMLLRWLAMA